jgi:predicted GNAT superfamily acetyltransferase
MLTIRPLSSLAEFHAAEEVQRAVWPGSDVEITPRHVLLTAAHNGGVVIGAFDEARLVGFVFGFLGTDEGPPTRPALARLKHCSHLLGVLPAYRDQDIGYRLKLAQRDWVNTQGVRLITWTYDPLESRNARLNIARLGAISRRYLREIYGDMEDHLNRGLPSDRFQAEWWITSTRVKERLLGRRAPLIVESFTSAGVAILNPAVPDSQGLPRPTAQAREALGTGLVTLIEIPPDFQALKRLDPGLALDWRLHTRYLFEVAFQAGYVVTDFLHETFEGRRRSFYALSQAEPRIEYSEN